MDPPAPPPDPKSRVIKGYVELVLSGRSNFPFWPIACKNESEISTTLVAVIQMMPPPAPPFLPGLLGSHTDLPPTYESPLEPPEPSCLASGPYQ